MAASPDLTEVKDLFGLMLEAADPGEGVDGPIAKEKAQVALAAASPSVRAAVEGLLAAHERASGVLLDGVNGDAPRAIDTAEPAPAAPPVPRITGYEIGEEIGRGGFGVVYRARQLLPVERPVAVKILRTEFASPEVIARFRAEARVLARMNHPSIARVLDAGLDDHRRPFVAMEYVDGQPLVGYCEQQELSVRERVRLLAEVCDAVHHAHQRAVIHRDLKPANVLVEQVDGRHRPRVIDFGIAKIVEEDVDETQKHTREGARLGTPRYMSPEQIMGTERGDVRTDVYALGVLLCEALTNKSPRDPAASDSAAGGAGHAGSRRGSGSRRASRRRSSRGTSRGGSRSGTRATRPSRLAAASEEPSVAQRSRELRGDLDRIILKAVAEEADERYESAAALGDDLERYLEGRPVQATPPGMLYLLGKFIARRRMTAVALFAALLSLIGGTLAATYGLARAQEGRLEAQHALIEADRQRLRSQEEAERAAFVTEFFLDDMLTAVDPDVAHGRDVTVAELLDVAADAAHVRFADAPELRRDVLGKIGTAYARISQPSAAARAFEEAIHVSEAIDGPQSATTLSLRLKLADALFGTVEGHARAGELRRANVADAVAALGETHPVALRARLAAVGQIQNTDELKRELLTILGTMESSVPEDTESLIHVTRLLGAFHQTTGDHEASLEYMARSADLSAKHFDPRHTRAILPRFRYGMALVEAGRIDEGEPIVNEALSAAREVYPPDHQTLTSIRVAAVRIPMERGRFNEAAAIVEDVLAIMAERDGVDSVGYVNQLSNLAMILLKSGDAPRAMELLEGVVPQQRKQWGPTHSRVGQTLRLLASAYLETNDFDRAMEILDESMRCEWPPGRARAQQEFAMIRARSLAGLGRRAEALATLDEAITVLESRGEISSADELLRLRKSLDDRGRRSER